LVVDSVVVVVVVFVVVAVAIRRSTLSPRGQTTRKSKKQSMHGESPVVASNYANQNNNFTN
jgi:hypothetical protein